MKEYYSCVFLMVVTTLRLELPNIAKVAVYLATHYVQTTTNIVIYGSASLHKRSERESIFLLVKDESMGWIPHIF